MDETWGIIVGVHRMILVYVDHTHKHFDSQLLISLQLQTSMITTRGIIGDAYQMIIVYTDHKHKYFDFANNYSYKAITHISTTGNNYMTWGYFVGAQQMILLHLLCTQAFLFYQQQKLPNNYSYHYTFKQTWLSSEASWEVHVYLIIVYTDNADRYS